MMQSGTVQKLIESHLKLIAMSPKNKRLSVLSHQVTYLMRLVNENGAMSPKALRSRLLDTATEAGIPREEAVTIIETALKWAHANEEVSQIEASNHKESR